MLRTLILVVLVIVFNDLQACTTFCIHTADQLVVGKNFDFYTGSGQVVTNKRGVVKHSLPLPPEKTLTWESKYGSITFNQMGVEFPYGGMNEKGLVIEISWLADTKYPEMDDRFGLTELQWIQYQLDNAATVAEVLASNSSVRISQQSLGPVHFFLCDAKGNKATFEYIDGQLVSHTGATLPLCVLTNDTYAQSRDYLQTLDARSETGKAFTTSSFDRFAEAASMVKSFKGKDAIGYAFNILAEVKQGDFTQWNIAYDIRRMTIHYKTRTNNLMRTLKMTDVDFGCTSSGVYADIDDNAKDGKLRFLPFSLDANRSQIKGAFSKVDFLQGVPADEVEMVAQYPASLKCAR